MKRSESPESQPYKPEFFLTLSLYTIPGAAQLFAADHIPPRLGHRGPSPGLGEACGPWRARKEELEARDAQPGATVQDDILDGSVKKYF